MTGRGGYVKFHRSLLDHPIWLGAPVSIGQAFIDLVGLANYQPSRVLVACSAFDEGGRGGYRFTGQGSYAELLPVKLSTLVVTPVGRETWCGFQISGTAVA